MNHSSLIEAAHYERKTQYFSKTQVKVAIEG